MKQGIIDPNVILNYLNYDEQGNKTGEYLGKFNTVEESNKYAEQLHKNQAKLIKPEEEEDTNSISKIENENVSKQIAESMENVKKVNKIPAPQTYRDVANIMKSFDVPQDTLKKMGTTEFTLKGLYSRTLEKAAYATAEPIWKALKAGSKAAGLDKMSEYFGDRLTASQAPPVTEEFDQQIAILLDDAKKKGKFHEAAANIGYGVMEALAFLTRAAIVKSIPGIGKVIPSGAELPKETAQLFTGLGTLADVKRNAAVLGGMGMMETPGDMATRLKGALFRIGYNITPFIANATPFTGWGARATDTMLNMFLSSDSYINAFKSSKDPGEFFVKVIPEFMSDVIFALQTTGSPMSNRVAQIGRMPGVEPGMRQSLVKMTRSEKIAFIEKADKMTEPVVDYGGEPKPITDRQDIVRNMETRKDMLTIDGVEQGAYRGESNIKPSDIPRVTTVEEDYVRQHQHKVIPKFPQKEWKVTDQKSLAKLGNAIAKEVGLDKWSIVWQIGKTKKSVPGGWTRPAHTINQATIRVKLPEPAGMYKGKIDKQRAALEYRLSRYTTPGNLLTGLRGNTHGNMVKLILHELGHLATPSKWNGKRWVRHAPAFHKWTKEYQGQLWKEPPMVLAKKPPGDLLKTEAFNKLVKESVKRSKQLEKIYPSKPKSLTKVQVTKAVKDFRVNTCIKSMERDGVVPDYVKDKITNEYKNWWVDASKVVKTYWYNNKLTENIAGVLDRGNPYGPNWKIIYGDMNDAQSKELVGNHTRVDSIKEFGEASFGKKGLAQFFTKRRAIGRFNLTDNDILGVHMGSYDKGVVRHLVRGNGFSKEEIAKCNDIVLNDPKLQAMSKWLFEKYVEDYAPLALVYKTMTGKDLPKRPFYIHIPVDMKDADFEKDNIAEQMMQRNQMGDHAYLKQGIVTARTYSGKPIGIGALSNYLKYTQESEHYKAYAQPVRTMKNLIDDPRYKEAINRNLGHDAWKILDKYLKDVAGTNKATNRDLLEKPAMMLRRHAGLAMIGCNILSAMRQPLSSMQAAAEIGMYHVLNGMQQVGVDYTATKDFVYSRSPQIKYRAGLFERFMAEEKATEKAPTVITGKMTRQKAFMYMVTNMDKWTVIAVWKGTYDRVMTTGRTIDGDKITNDNLERVAIAEADRVVRKTQPAATAKDLPGFHRGGTIAKLFTMFQNQTNKNLNYFDYDIRYKLQTGKITPAKAAYKVLFSYVMPAMM